MSASIRVHVARPDRLGPDPEPLASERCKRILSHAGEHLAERTAPAAPAAARNCPVERALGRLAPCRGRACVYYRVPGVAGSCAVATWTGAMGPDRRLAAWFVARLREAEAHLTASDSGERLGKERR